jgi:hypothetical protein
MEPHPLLFYRFYHILCVPGTTPLLNQGRATDCVNLVRITTLGQGEQVSRWGVVKEYKHLTSTNN